MIIYKYPVFTSTFTLDLPRGATILSIQVQNGAPTMWALVDKDAAHEKRSFTVISTGSPIRHDIAHLVYVGTFQVAAGVWHLFEVT